MAPAHKSVHAETGPGAACGFDEVWSDGIDRHKESCDAAGGRFYPIIFGWMVHVYPYEADARKRFGSSEETELCG